MDEVDFCKEKSDRWLFYFWSAGYTDYAFENEITAFPDNKSGIETVKW